MNPTFDGTKEKLPIKNDEQGERITPLCVRRDPLRIAAQRKSLAALKRCYGLYSFHPLQMQAFDGLKIIKPYCFRNKAFSL